MNSKMTTNSQPSTTEPKNKNKDKLSKQLEQEQIDRKWRSHAGLSVGMGRRDNGGKGTGNKKHKW